MTTKKAVIKTDSKIVRNNKSNEKVILDKPVIIKDGGLIRKRSYNAKKFIESMDLDELLEVSKLSNAYLHGDKITKISSTKAASYCSKIANSKASSINMMNNEINERIVKLNEERYTPTKQSKALYEKFMED